jgi:hypothetical protein
VKAFAATAKAAKAVGLFVAVNLILSKHQKIFPQRPSIANIQAFGLEGKETVSAPDQQNIFSLRDDIVGSRGNSDIARV